MKVLLVVDESPSSIMAVDAAERLLLSRDCEVNVITAFQPLMTGVVHRHPVIGCMVRALAAETRDRQQEAAWALVQRAAAHLCQTGACIEMQVHCSRRPVEVIVRAAREWGADVVVMGSDVAMGLRGWLHSSITTAVIARAHCPVLVAPAALERDSRGQMPTELSEGASTLAG